MKAISADTDRLQVIKNAASVTTLVLYPAPDAGPIGDTFRRWHTVDLGKQGNCSVDHVEGDKDLCNEVLVLNFIDWSRMQHGPDIFEGSATNEFHMHLVIRAARLLSRYTEHQRARMADNLSDSGVLVRDEASCGCTLSLLSDPLLVACYGKCSPNGCDRANGLNPTGSWSRPQRLAKRAQEEKNTYECAERDSAGEKDACRIEQPFQDDLVDKRLILARSIA